MLRTGILLPRSTLFPSLGLDILNAVKVYLKEKGIAGQVQLLTDNIGFGFDEQEIYTKAEKMLLQDDVDVMILCADTRITEMLTPLFMASNKLLLALNFGANFPDNWHPGPSTTITHSLNFCFHTWSTGKLAAAESDKQSVNTLSYYDAGYRLTYCMFNSHQEEGGIPAHYHITHLRINEFTIEPLKTFLDTRDDVHTMLCLFAGEQAEAFYKAIGPVQQKHALNLYVSPMMLDETLALPADSSFEVKGYTPWHSSLDNAANDLFTKAYVAAMDKPVNYFSLLGWETGMLLQEILEQHEAGLNAKKIVQHLGTVAFESPRGALCIDPKSQYSYGPLYLARRNSNGVVIEKEEPQTAERWAAFTTIQLQGESSSWRNTYLCI